MRDRVVEQIIEVEFVHLSISIESPKVGAFYKLRGGELKTVLGGVENLIKGLGRQNVPRNLLILL